MNHHHFWKWVAVCAGGFWASIGFAVEKVKYLPPSHGPEIYGVPAGAIKIGPHRERNPEIFLIEYYSGEIKAQNFAAMEKIKNGMRIELVLFKEMERHGLQREWHDNGMKKSEIPFRDGLVDGVACVWADDGALIGRYRMVNGTGTVRIYSRDGQLMEEESFKRGKPDGLSVKRIGGGIVCSWSKDGALVGRQYNVTDNGTLSFLLHYPVPGRLGGPYLAFSESGEAFVLKWWIDHKDVSESEYRDFAKGKSDYPKYRENPNDYRLDIPPEEWALIEKYRKMPRVKIPLQFGPDGHPLLMDQADGSK